MNAKIIFRRKFPSKCNKPIVKWYKPHGAIHFLVIFMRQNLNFFSAPVNLVRHNIYATVAL